MSGTRLGVLLVASALLCGPARAQQAGQSPSPCGMPQLPPVSREQNLFSPEQAGLLGDIVLAQIGREFKLVRDPALDGYLQRIADRLSAITGVGAVQVGLVDLPEPNALTVPGGHVLVARKLVAVARSEDELAGVFAHEFGHIVKRDPERDMSALMRATLKVTAVGDRADIEARYNQLIENRRRSGNPRVDRESDKEQEIADQVGIWLMARAGYSPQAYVDVFDRVMELKSDTGNWLSDFFGMTRPESRRLRAALKAAAALPPACVGARPTGTAEFAQWQQNAVQASRGARTAALHDVLSERKLDPALRSDLAHLKFSPDGKWVLAQDDSNVYVFSRDPLAFVFRIDASGAQPARFAPDSTALVFYDDNYRVERWNVASKSREWVHEVVMPKGCVASELSADGAFIACVTPDFTLRLQEVAGGSLVFEKKDFYRVTLDDVIALVNAQLNPDRRLAFFQMHFSPDARYLVVARGATSVAVDVARRETISLPGAVRDRLGFSFSFLDDGRIVGVHAENPQESAIVTFPQGEIVAKLKMGRLPVEAAAKGDRYIIVRGIPGYQANIVDVKANKAILGTPLPGFDVYEDSFLSERKNGELGLYTVGRRDAVAAVEVPTGPLGRLRAADISPDLALLAISLGSRGGTWDTTSGQRSMFVRGFRGVLVDAGHRGYADFPRDGRSQRVIAQLDPVERRASPLIGIEPPPPAPRDGQTVPVRRGDLQVATTIVAQRVDQYGRFLLAWKRDPNRQSDPRTLAVHDAISGKDLWTRDFPKGEPAAVRAEGRHGTLMFHWPYTSDGARAIVDAHRDLKAQFDKMGARREDVSVTEIVDLATGTTRGYILIDFAGGSFRLRSVVGVGDRLVFNDNQNRTVVYSLATGKETGHAFGTPLDVSKDGNAVAVQNEAGQVMLFSLPAMEKIDELSFPSEVAFARFTDDGSRLFVLTANQTAYTLRVKGTS